MKTFIYEEDLFPGALIGEAALGGIDKQLQTVMTISSCEFLVINVADYRAIDERSGVKSMSVNDKYQFLRNIPLFDHFENFDVFKIAQALVLELIPKHSSVLKKCAICDSLKFVTNY